MSKSRRKNDSSLCRIALPARSRHKEELAGAVRRYEEIVAANPGNTETWRDLALFYTALGENGKAEAALKRATTLRHNFANAWDLLGMYYWDEYQYLQAVVAFEKATEIDPNYTHAWAGLAQMCAILKWREEAENALHELRKRDKAYGKQIAFVVREFLEQDAPTKETIKKYNLEEE